MPAGDVSMYGARMGQPVYGTPPAGGGSGLTMGGNPQSSNNPQQPGMAQTLQLIKAMQDAQKAGGGASKGGGLFSGLKGGGAGGGAGVPNDAGTPTIAADTAIA